MGAQPYASPVTTSLAVEMAKIFSISDSLGKQRPRPDDVGAILDGAPWRVNAARRMPNAISAVLP